MEEGMIFNPVHLESKTVTLVFVDDPEQPNVTLKVTYRQCYSFKTIWNMIEDLDDIDQLNRPSQPPTLDKDQPEQVDESKSCDNILPVIPIIHTAQSTFKIALNYIDKLYSLGLGYGTRIAPSIFTEKNPFLKPEPITITTWEEKYIPCDADQGMKRFYSLKHLLDYIEQIRMAELILMYFARDIQNLSIVELRKKYTIPDDLTAKEKKQIEKIHRCTRYLNPDCNEEDEDLQLL